MYLFIFAVSDGGIDFKPSSISKRLLLERILAATDLNRWVRFIQFMVVAYLQRVMGQSSYLLHCYRRTYLWFYGYPTTMPLAVSHAYFDSFARHLLSMLS